ncbi:MAG TPA: 23S rRNA (adenine(2503)-C(2))-methyltransferase RlmN [Acidimicrobiales bacterium]|nr:23S rRNA (adenine(2503)-C(2))-methyltransferase RlmN [Acidimicrobiales bacterium]
MSRFDLTRQGLADILVGEPPYRVGQVWSGLYRRLAEPGEMTDLPAALRARLGDDPRLAPALALEVETRSDADQTRKWGWRLADGARIETVLMHYPDRSTACVSSQAGCAMGCGFCATGQAGLTRSLTTGEIVEQVVRAARACRDEARRLSNVVFMGMGEPLANYRRVWAAIEAIHAHLGLSSRHLTVSTVGLVPGIRRLAREDLAVSLAVSLHAATDEVRDRLVPVNRRWPLGQLVAACEDYTSATGRRLSFEWALIDGVNDRPGDATALAALARPLRAHVNLIPLNPTPGWPTRGTPAPGVAAFAAALVDQGVATTVRRTRGSDIGAACGQLASPRRGDRSPGAGPLALAD